MEFSRKLVTSLFLSASGQLHSSYRRHELYSSQQCLLAIFTPLLKSQSRGTWYVNKHQCMVLTQVLACMRKLVMKADIRENEPLFHELGAIVSDAARLIDLCDCQVRDVNLSRIFTLFQSKDVFTVVLSKLVWYTSEFLLRRDYLEILHHILPEFWELQMKEAARKDHKSLLSEIKNLLDVPPHLLQWLMYKERSTIMYIHKSEIKINIREKVGQGSFGQVYKADWHGERCASKEIDSPDHAAFQKEATVQAMLHHPNIVQFIGCVVDNSRSSLLMELMDYDLHDLLRSMEGELNLIVAVDIMLQVAEAMKFLHAANIVHRDLKSGNILIKEMDNCDAMVGCYLVKVTDFGLARTKFKSVESSWTSNVGTLKWRAPELLENLSEDGNTIDPTYIFPKQADVYSYGITCSEILSGKPPYSDWEKPTQSLRQDILQGRRPIFPKERCPELTSLVTQCWDKNPGNRPSFDDVCITLKRIKATLLKGQCQPSCKFRHPIPSISRESPCS